MSTSPDAYGDFQTPRELAVQVWNVVDTASVEVCIEPTVGRGAFLQTVPVTAAALPWIAFDINSEYVAESQAIADRRGLPARIECADAFALTADDLSVRGRTVLAVGNPPWVTNADQGRRSATNLPQKRNRFGLAGLDAMTGKSNFDVAESILLGLLDALRNAEEVRLAFLIKRSVALKLARGLLGKPGVVDASFSAIDAMRWFGASVEAGLLQLTYRPGATDTTNALRLHHAIGSKACGRAGFVGDHFVLDIDGYERGGGVEAAAGQGLIWRQGIKHDAAKVLELRRTALGGLVNGYGEFVHIEAEALHPFYKSSDVSCGRDASRWFPLYQHDLSGPFVDLSSRWPNLFCYLSEHREQLGARKSSIYRGKPDFMLFGVGAYTLAPWKVAISGFYKKAAFTVLGSDQHGRSPVVDDTCYVLPFDNEASAREAAEYLNSAEVRDFLYAIADTAAKRPFTKEVLGRIAMPASHRVGRAQLTLDIAA